MAWLFENVKLMDIKATEGVSDKTGKVWRMVNAQVHEELGTTEKPKGALIDVSLDSNFPQSVIDSLNRELAGDKVVRVTIRLTRYNAQTYGSFANVQFSGEMIKPHVVIPKRIDVEEDTAPVQPVQPPKTEQQK